MKYWCTESERNGSCYHEFKKGKYNGEVWSKDSIYLHDDDLEKLHLDEFFLTVIPTYDRWGITEVTKKDWGRLYQAAEESTPKIKELLQEMNEWVEETYKRESVITILGI